MNKNLMLDKLDEICFILQKEGILFKDAELHMNSRSIARYEEELENLTGVFMVNSTNQDNDTMKINGISVKLNDELEDNIILAIAWNKKIDPAAIADNEEITSFGLMYKCSFNINETD